MQRSLTLVGLALAVSVAGCGGNHANGISEDLQNATGGIQEDLSSLRIDAPKCAKLEQSVPTPEPDSCANLSLDVGSLLDELKTARENGAPQFYVNQVLDDIEAGLRGTDDICSCRHDIGRAWRQLAPSYS